jgi:OmpA-OmpF porin, OOP family
MRTATAAGLLIFWGALYAADDKPKFDIRKPLGELYAANHLVAPEQSRLVIFRAQGDASMGVVTVYLGEKYHVSLQPNAFSSECLETDKIDIRTRLTLPDAEPTPELDTRHSLVLNKSITQFVRVTQRSDGSTRLQEVPARIAQDELKSARQQMHARSRATVVRACKEVKEAVLAFEPNLITFGADATFGHKQTDLNSLSASGKQALRQVVDKLNTRYANAAAVNIRVIGYADDNRDEASNTRMALARAHAVKTYFVSNGLRADELTEEGRCVTQDEKAVALNLSNRRVDVEVLIKNP